jgi:KEOPS complex subunit Cgi121
VLTYIQEFRKYCEIAGFKNLEIDNTEGFLEEINRKKPVDVEVQFFDADIVATWQHLYFAVLNAMTAFRNRENISKSLSIETLLYTSARRQIRKAMQLVGIKPTSPNIALLIVEGKPDAVKSALSKISTCIDGQPDDSVLGLSAEKIERIKRAFTISEAQLETVMDKDGVEKAIIDLVIEQVALLATLR